MYVLPDGNFQLITKKSDEFYSRLQKYVFRSQDDDLDEETILDVDDLVTNGVPIDSYGADMEFVGFLNPNIPNNSNQV